MIHRQAIAFVLAMLAVPTAEALAQKEARSRQVAQYDARTFFETTSISGASFSRDESMILFSSDASGVYNAYTLPISGGKPEARTRSTTHAIFAQSWFPGDDRILYTADQGGNELDHVYVLMPDATRNDITPGDKLKASFAEWSLDRKVFFVTTNERDNRYFDVYRYATDTLSRDLVFKNTDGFSPGDISGDGRYIALGKTNDNTDSDVYLFDTLAPDQKPKRVTPHEGKATHDPATFSPDGTKLYYSTNAHGEFQQIWSYDLNSGRHERVIQADWDVMFVAFSEHGRYRVSGINEDARTVIHVVDTTTGKEIRLPDLPQGDITGVTIAPSETKMVFTVNGDTSPSNLFVLELTTGQHRQLTQTLNPAIQPSDLVSAEVIRYKSFDGLEIPALLYRPWPASPLALAPAIVSVHGGPGGQSRRGYSADIQYLVNHGYAVLRVNNRGSSGYGKTFFHKDDRRHGEDDLKDCIFGRKYLERLDWVDGSRVGIMGGSYGGFMVAAALTIEPEAFNVGVDIFGVTNWVRTLKNIPAWWAANRDRLYDEMGDPATDEARLKRISPLFNADKIKRPLIVIQGANDPRVLQVESDELVAAAKKNGAPVEYVIFPDEGHGFLKKDNRITSASKILGFLDRYLRGEKAAPAGQ